MISLYRITTQLLSLFITLLVLGTGTNALADNERYELLLVPFGDLFFFADQDYITWVDYDGAYLWSLDSGYQSLGFPEDHEQFIVRALKAPRGGGSPVVLGDVNSGFPRPYYLWKDGEYQPVLENFHPDDVNTNGDMVGSLYTESGQGWESTPGAYFDGQFTSFAEMFPPPPGFTITVWPRHLNDSGEFSAAVNFYEHATGNSAEVPMLFFKDSKGEYQGAIWNEEFYPADLNNRGCILAIDNDFNPERRNRILCPRANIELNLPSQDSCYFRDMNDFYEVIGSCFDKDTNTFQAVLWSPHRGLETLKDLVDTGNTTVDQFIVQKINNDRTIYGNAFIDNQPSRMMLKRIPGPDIATYGYRAGD